VQLPNHIYTGRFLLQLLESEKCDSAVFILHLELEFMLSLEIGTLPPFESDDGHHGDLVPGLQGNVLHDLC
jgi:hypothetical protein